MTFNQINYFLNVAKHLSFTKAASSLFITQSTLSRSIASLEDELGVVLLKRDFHNLSLTPAGELFYQEMDGIMESVQDILMRVQDLSSNQTSFFPIGLLDGQEIETDFLFSLRNLSDLYPQYNLNLQRMSHKDLMAALKNGKLDVFETLVSQEAAADPTLDVLILKKVGSVLIARDDDPIWDSPISLHSVDGRTLIVPADHHPSDSMIRKTISSACVTPEFKMAPDLQSHSLWLEAGLGVSILNTGSVIYSSSAARHLKTAPLTELPPLYVALISRRNYHTPLLDTFLSYIGKQRIDE